MFKFKKLFFMTALVALLAVVVLPATSAFALTTRKVRFATVDKVTVVSAQPASFRVRGTYICDKPQIVSSVQGKVITINVWSAKIVDGDTPCATKQSYNRLVNVGVLVPGKYTVYINRTTSGQAKKFTFIAPLIATRTPTPQVTTQ